MADFPIYCHIRYDAEPNKSGNLRLLAQMSATMILSRLSGAKIAYTPETVTVRLTGQKMGRTTAPSARGGQKNAG